MVNDPRDAETRLELVNKLRWNARNLSVDGLSIFHSIPVALKEKSARFSATRGMKSLLVPRCCHSLSLSLSLSSLSNVLRVAHARVRSLFHGHFAYRVKSER